MVKIDIKSTLLDIKLDINRGEIIGVVGDSGSGKTSLLRVISGLNSASGKIVVDGESWLKNNRSLPPQKRSVGFVMQDYALFENMSVLDNLLFVNRDFNLAKRLLTSVDLWELKDRFPNTLSGGQKQRVALSRAIIKKPKVLLLDEPLSALHPTMRYRLQSEILNFHKEFNLTTILVSHDISEVAKLANRVVVIKDGKIKAIKNLGKSKYEQEFLLAQIIDKKIDSNKYQFIVNIANSTLTLSVDRLKFNSYNIGDFIELGVKL